MVGLVWIWQVWILYYGFDVKDFTIRHVEVQHIMIPPIRIKCVIIWYVMPKHVRIWHTVLCFSPLPVRWINLQGRVIIVHFDMLIFSMSELNMLWFNGLRLNQVCSKSLESKLTCNYKLWLLMLISKTLEFLDVRIQQVRIQHVRIWHICVFLQGLLSELTCKDVLQLDRVIFGMLVINMSTLIITLFCFFLQCLESKSVTRNDVLLLDMPEAGS